MNPLLEVNPSACVVVVGPTVARSCLLDPPSYLKLTFHSFLKAGQELLKANECGWNMQDLEKTAKEVDTELSKRGLRDKWIQSHLALSGVQTLSTTPTIQLLLQLQTQGCKLVYSYYDTILDTIAGTEPVLLSNAHQVEQWMNGKANGFLHLHGSHSMLSSIVLYTEQYNSLIKGSGLFVRLKELFRQKTFLFVGHETKQFNPLLSLLVKVFLDDDGIIKNPPLLITSLPKVPNCFLHLPITEHEENMLQELISISHEGSFVTGKTNERTQDKDIARSQAVLIFSEKQSFRKLGDIIYQLNQSGEIYVRRDALTILFGSKIMYGNVLTYGGNGLHQIWDLVTSQGSILQSKGLVAIGLQSALMVWINRKPSGLGTITDVNTFHSLWNNSVTAINQPNSSATPSTGNPLPLPTTPFTPSPTLTAPYYHNTPVITLPLGYQTSYLPHLYPATFAPVISSPMANLVPPHKQTLLLPTTSKQSTSSTCSNDSAESPVGSSNIPVSSISTLLQVGSPESLETANQYVLEANKIPILCTERDDSASPPATDEHNDTSRCSPVAPSTAIAQEPATTSIATTTAPRDVSTNPEPGPIQRPLTLSQLPLSLTLPRLPSHGLTCIPFPLAGHHILNRPILNPLISPFSLYNQNLSFLTMGSQPLGVSATTSMIGTKHKLTEPPEVPIETKKKALERSQSSPAIVDIEGTPQDIVHQIKRTNTGITVKHLWQFLLHLLLSPNHGQIIQWTGQGYEFRIIDPTIVTKLWREESNNTELTFNGLLGELRSYSGLNILEKVEEKDLTYQFKIDIQNYLAFCTSYK